MVNTMNTKQCFKCKLELPMSVLKPVIVQIQNRPQRTFLCEYCLEEVKNAKEKRD